ncbi:hypothetical protein AOLI_G00049490 [Acnodon oligacanthus]
MFVGSEAPEGLFHFISSGISLEENRSVAFHALQPADKQSQLYPQHVDQLNGGSVWTAGWSLPSEGGRATHCRPKPQCPIELPLSQTKRMPVLGGPVGLSYIESTLAADGPSGAKGKNPVKQSE